MRGKAIQEFLTNGSPRGIKLAEITSNIEIAIFIPRTKINEANTERKFLIQEFISYSEKAKNLQNHLFTYVNREII